MKLVVIAIFAGLVTFSSAVQLVLNRHASRSLFVELQELRNDKQKLDQEWGQLLLEQATWATNVRIEDIAQGSLGMVSPRPDEIVEIR